MSNEFYQYTLADRRRFLADAEFVRDDLRIWSHPDGRAIGDGVAAALTDKAFFRFLKIDPPETEIDQEQLDSGTISERETTNSGTTNFLG